MSTRWFVELDVELAGLQWLADLGFAIAHGPEIAIGQPGAERSDPTYRDVVLEHRLREALVRLNPDLPPEALDDAFRKIVRADGPSLIERNRLRRSGGQRLAGGQPVHGGRAAGAGPAGGHRDLRQRAASGRDRAEEPGR